MMKLGRLEMVLSWIEAGMLRQIIDISNQFKSECYLRAEKGALPTTRNWRIFMIHPFQNELPNGLISCKHQKIGLDINE